MQRFSRSKTIFLRLSKIGRNYLPFIKELETYNVKFIDILQSYIDYDGVDVIETLSSGAYLTLADKFDNLFYDQVDIINFNSAYYLGQHKLIDRKLVLQNCFIDLQNPNYIGRVVAITFYWDEPQYTNGNNTQKTFKELVELIVLPSSNKYIRIKFQDIRTIAGKRIRSIRQHYDNAITPLGYPTLPINSVLHFSIYLTLANGNNILVDKLDLTAMYDNYRLLPLEFDNLLVNFPDSYVEVVVTTALEQTTSIPLLIEYLED